MHKQTIEKNLSPQDSIIALLHEAYIYFSSKDKIEIPNMASFQAYLGSLLYSNGSPFRVDTHSKRILIPSLMPEERATRKIVWEGRKVLLTDAIQSFARAYKTLLPTLSKHTFSENNTQESSIKLVCEVIGLMYNQEKDSRKKDANIPWTVAYNNTIYKLPIPQKNKEVIENSKKDVATTMQVETKKGLDVVIRDIEDVILYINKCSIPVTISSVKNTIQLKNSNIKHMHDLLPPNCYNLEYKDIASDLGKIMNVCASKRPNYFKRYTTEYIASSDYKTNLHRLYKTFLEGFIALYIGKNGRSIKLVDVKEKELKWLGTVSIIKSSTGGRSGVNVEEKIGRSSLINYSLKKKFTNTEKDLDKTITADTFRDLGYEKAFSTRLYNFCLKEIIKGNPESFTLADLVSARTALAPMRIAYFNKNKPFSYVIRALDHVLDEFIANSGDTHAERAMRGKM